MERSGAVHREIGPLDQLTLHVRTLMVSELGLSCAVRVVVIRGARYQRYALAPATSPRVAQFRAGTSARNPSP